jgi:S-layer protein
VTIDASQPAPTLTSIENIIIQSTAAVADFDFTNADTSVASITVTSSTTALDLVAVQSNFDLSIDNSSGAVTVTFSDDHLDSATATFDIALDNSTSAVTVESGGDDLITTLTVDASGDDSSMALTMVADDLGDDDLTTLTVTGDAALTITEAGAEFSVLTTLNFGGNSGGVTIDLDANAEDYTITGSSGDDVITADQASTDGDGRTINLGAGDDTLDIGSLAQVADTYTGGAGTDTLISTAALTSAGMVNKTGFEVLSLATGLTQDLSVVATNTWTSVIANGSVAITNAPTSVTTLGLAGAGTTSFARLVDGTEDSLIVDVQSASTAGVALTLSHEETISIVAEFALTLTTGLTAADLTSLVVSGDSTVDLSAVAAASLASVDASGLTAAAQLIISSTTSTADMTVTGNTATTGYTGLLSVVTGTGDDTITGTVNADVINAGAGDDVIVAGGGADQITGGAGSDTITLGTDTTAADVFLTSSIGTDTITGFDTTEDDIDVSALVAGTVLVVAIASTATAATATLVADDVYVISDGSQAHGVATSAASIVDYTDLVDVAAYLSFTALDANTTATGTALAAGDQLVFVINDLVGNKTYVYSFIEDGVLDDPATDSVVSSGELALVAMITEESGAALVAGDFV